MDSIDDDDDNDDDWVIYGSALMNHIPKNFKLLYKAGETYK